MVQFLYSKLGAHTKHKTSGYNNSGSQLLTLEDERMQRMQPLLGIRPKCSRHILGMAVSLALHLERKGNFRQTE